MREKAQQRQKVPALPWRADASQAEAPGQEMVQDLMTITHCFSARLSGLRNYRKALDRALKDTAA
jgi:predicted site-specific integrase-resolvase